MKVLEMVHGIIWGPWTVGVFLVVGLVLSVRCRFFQIRGFRYWWKATAGSLWGEEREGDESTGAAGAHHGITQFQSVCTALAATVGTGNIAGVAAALVSGGPGAVFWMWISALIGMATAYGETYLGVRYRFKNNRGKWICGPFVYMKKGWVSLLWQHVTAFSAFCVPLEWEVWYRQIQQQRHWNLPGGSRRC